MLEMMIDENRKDVQHFLDSSDRFGNDENPKQVHSFVDYFEIGQTKHFVEELCLQCSFVFSFIDIFPMSFPKNYSH